MATSVNTVRTEGVAVTSSVAGLRQIPPRSFIIYESNVWITRGFLKIPKEEYARVQSILDDGTKVNVREIGFREDESPLRFRTYLSLEYEGEGSRTVGLDHSFYVSGITRAGRYLKGDKKPWLEKPTVLTGVAAGVVTGVLVFGAAAIAFNNSGNTEKK